MAAANAARLSGPSCTGLCSQAVSQRHVRASSAACPLLPPRVKLALVRPNLSEKGFLSGRTLVPAAASGAGFKRSRYAAPRAQLIVEGGGRGESENGAVNEASVTPELIASLEKQLQAQALERPSANGKPLDPSVERERSELAAVIQKVSQKASLASPNKVAANPVNGKTSVQAVEAVLTSANGAAQVDKPVIVTPAAAPVLEVQEGPQAARKPQVSVTPGGRWNKFKTYSTIQRTFEIWSFVATFVVRFLLIKQKRSYRGGMTEAKQKSRRQALALWLKEGLLRLGPTFIKIGQQFSTRVDVLSQEYIDELSQLQDQVPAFDSETSVAIVEAELGAPVTQLFERFDPVPIAAASLGQVHRARISGREVVVKVQRPGLKALFDIDLKNLRVLAQNLQKIDPKSDGAKRDWVAIYDECANLLYQEIDYSNEGRNAERFGKNFAEFDWVKVPKIYWEYTTPQVLTMEYCPGIKINNIAAIDEVGIDRKRLARLSVEAYLQQILKHGFFHADPHPGNIAVDAQGGGRLIFYDFGMMGSISSNIREGLVDAFYGVYQKSADKVLDAMVQMGVLVPTGDMIAVRRTAQFFLNSFEERLKSQRAEKEAAEKEARRLWFKKQLSKEEKTTKRSQRLAAIGEDLLALSADQPFRFPATFTFVVRAFSILDGIGKGLDPRFDISEIAKPYAQELLNLKEAGAQIFVRDLQRRWDRQASAFANLFRGPDRVAKLEKVVTALEQGDLKLRVRTLESERAFKRVAQVQSNIGKAILAGTLLNVGTVLYSTARALNPAATAAFTLSAFLALQVVIGNLKVRKLDKTEASITGAAL